MKISYTTLLLAICFFAGTQSSFAQSVITFRVDLKQQMKDSVFIPSQHSVVVTGNQLPFTSTNSFKLTDEAPVDSVFVIEVRFPSFVMGKTLEYNYIIEREKGDLKEQRPRLLPLKDKNRKLNETYFNQFAR